VLASAVCPAQEKSSDSLSDSDKAEIVRLTLERALVKREIPDYNYIKDLEHVLISNKNIKTELLPKFEGIGFVLLKPEEIEERAGGDAGHYVYFLEFGKFQVEDVKVIVELNHYPKYNKKPGLMAFGGALVFECQRQDGKWACEVKYRVIV
jgi:hypothetical protein